MRNSKPYSKFLFCILIAISSILLPSCNPLNAPNESNDSIVGTWTTPGEVHVITEFSSSKNGEPIEATVYGIHRFTFTEDGKFTDYIKTTRREVTKGNEEDLHEFQPEERWEKGTYTYNEETKEVFTVGTEKSNDGKIWIPLNYEDNGCLYYSINGDYALFAYLAGSLNETINSFFNGDAAAFYEELNKNCTRLTRQ